MSNQKTPLSLKVRIIHRDLGYFLAGIMAMYAISGSLMVFRKTNFLKKEVIEQQQLGTKLSIGELSSSLKIGVKVEKREGSIIYFKEGNYDEESGIAQVKKM